MQEEAQLEEQRLKVEAAHAAARHNRDRLLAGRKVADRANAAARAELERETARARVAHQVDCFNTALATAGRPNRAADVSCTMLAE